MTSVSADLSETTSTDSEEGNKTTTAEPEHSESHRDDDVSSTVSTCSLITSCCRKNNNSGCMRTLLLRGQRSEVSCVFKGTIRWLTCEMVRRPAAAAAAV